MKTAIAHHPVATSYANTYKVAAAYPGYHAPIAAAYHAPIAAAAYSSYPLGSTYHGNAYHGALAAPIVKAAYPAYGAAYATYHH